MCRQLAGMDGLVSRTTKGGKLEPHL
eukprot:SAG25_NODE_3772_length_975_cov_0.517123_1_plen_25_part_10